MASNHRADSDQTAGLFASFVTFLSNKEKLTVSLFQKDFLQNPTSLNPNLSYKLMQKNKCCCTASFSIFLDILDLL
jgi:hypothetical protein